MSMITDEEIQQQYEACLAESKIWEATILEERNVVDTLHSNVVTGSTIDLEPNTTGLWSQVKFKTLSDELVRIASEYADIHNRRHVALLVSPDVATVFQSLNNSNFKAVLHHDHPQSSVFVVGHISDGITVYCDTFAVESYCMIFATDSTRPTNKSILEEHMYSLHGVKLVSVGGICKYFPSISPCENIPEVTIS